MRLDYDVWTWAIKVFTSIIVIVLNYVFSKFIIFKRKIEKPEFLKGPKCVDGIYHGK